MTVAPPARFCPRCGSALEAARCPRDGYRWYADPKVGVGVVIADRSEAHREERGARILLVRRNHEPAMGRWAFPSGFVDAGEVLEEAAIREVREETGVEVRLERLLGAWSTAGDAVVFLAYAGVVVRGEAVAGPEATEVGWFALDALPALAFPHDDAIIEAWRSGAGAPIVAPSMASSAASSTAAGEERA